ncbi:MAG: hypothetical protein K6F01_03525 [Selenomonas sp.]|uniref:hypothetical protein n=1 Tax=Selenomonas sp. TaxID=2053611 RepID=UPI0025F2CB47|nr:hypothetical protein [Selenomonas sp.]MCR5438493.1 hypothetical protein [Selenomonas sp.]
MKKSQIIIAAVILYLIIMTMGGAAYYAYSIQHDARQARIAQEAQDEAAERKAVQEKAAEQEKKPEEEPKEQRTSKRAGSMEVETRGGVDYYKHPWPVKPPSGVYLRPFVAERNGVCVFKNDIYYFYEITDPAQTAWIFGDRLAIHAGGQTTTLELDPSKLHKHMASDASWLAENYVMNADKKTLAAYRRIAKSDSAYIVYYKVGGKERRHDLSAQEIKRIREMVELYDTLSQP